MIDFVPTAATRPDLVSALVHATFAFTFKRSTSPTFASAAVTAYAGRNGTVRDSAVREANQSRATLTSGVSARCSRARRASSAACTGDSAVDAASNASMDVDTDANSAPRGAKGLALPVRAAMVGPVLPSASTSTGDDVPNEVAVETRVRAYSPLMADGEVIQVVMLALPAGGINTSPSASTRAAIGPHTLAPVAEMVTGTVSARLEASATTRAVPTATAVTSPVEFTEASVGSSVL